MTITLYSTLPLTQVRNPDWMTLRDALPWLAPMETCPQDPDHHGEGNVATHVRMVMEALLADDGFDDLCEADLRMMFWAVLLHDVAKPATTRMDDGRWRAPGHSSKGQVMARGILWHLGAPWRERETICHLITHHQLPFYLLEREDWQRRLARISWQTRCDLLVRLARADATGRICIDQGAMLDRVALFEQAALDQECLYQPRQFSGEHARFRFFRDDDRYIDAPTFDDRVCEAVILSGLPGSGKSAWITNHREGRHVIALDGIREDLEIDPADAQGRVIAEAREQARIALRKAESFIWDATNITRRTRNAIIDLADSYRARIRIVAVETTPPELFRRNDSRSGIAQVPPRAMETMIRKWEMPDLTECHELTVIETG